MIFNPRIIFPMQDVVIFSKLFELNSLVDGLNSNHNVETRNLR